MKYLPPSPPDKRHLPVVSIEKSQPRSSCPSPTPIFQQLYLAVAHWERYLRDSPELFPRSPGRFDEDDQLRSGMLSPSDDVFDEAGDIGRRRSSLQVGFSPARQVYSTPGEKQRRRSSPAEFSKANSGITIRISDGQYCIEGGVVV